jgi:hypothetical protein
VEQQQDANYHPMTASPSSRPATTTNTAAMGEEQHTRESIARTPPPPPTPPLFNNLHEYFQPVFDELDKLNKMLDSNPFHRASLQSFMALSSLYLCLRVDNSSGLIGDKTSF